MCGIFGYFDRRKLPLDRGAVERMGRSIEYRGPDDSGIHVDDFAALGNHRLSIIDVAGGHQPFYSEDGQIVVVQNGEIFNYVELMAELEAMGHPCRTHSDTEVLLRFYESEGIGFLSRLNGMFTIAILDRRQDALYLARDRIGVKPLYIHDDGRRLLFASEIKALLVAGAPAELDERALDMYITYNYVPPPLTMFRDIRHLPPGAVMRIDASGASTSTWWELPPLAGAERRSEAEWIEAVDATLDDAVRLRMRADVPFGAFLSGGVDSSTVVGHMSRHAREPVRTFAIGFDDPRFDESAYAAAAARRFDTRHVCETVSPDMLDLWPLVTYHCDQPHGDVSFMPTYRLSQLAAREVKVVLTGDGGDELFAGYDKYKAFFAAPEALRMGEAEFVAGYCRQLCLFDAAEKARLYGPRLAAELAGHDAWAPVKAIVGAAPHLDRINQALLIDTLLLLPGNNLVKPDRMGMAVSLEARTPFLDYRMVELAFRMPGTLKLRGAETKYILKKACAPLIGDELAYRKKQMFTVPIGEWLRQTQAGIAYEILLSRKAADRGLFELDFVHEMIRRHVAREANYTRQIRALIALELWFCRFIDAADVAETGGAAARAARRA
jgi:asparagine synthase (glutamine-hydrolysing)